jgi:hypothetical protein
MRTTIDGSRRINSIWALIFPTYPISLKEISNLPNPPPLPNTSLNVPERLIFWERLFKIKEKLIT